MIRLYMTNPGETLPRRCALTDVTLAPGETVEVNEIVAAQHLADEPDGFFIGYDLPDWDYYKAPRADATV